MARGVNKCLLIGNLGADPDTRYTANGNPVTNIRLATDESYKDRNTGQMVPRTEWHNVVIFGKTAEIAGQYLRKGSKAYIEGRLQTEKWQDQSGNDRYTTKIIVDIKGQMQMLGGTGGDGQGHAEPPADDRRPASQPTDGSPEPVEDFDSDIPF